MKIFYKSLLIICSVAILCSCEKDDDIVNNYLKIEGQTFELVSASYDTVINSNYYLHRFYLTTDNITTEGSSVLGEDETTYLTVGVFFHTESPTLTDGIYPGLSVTNINDAGYLFYQTENYYYYGNYYDSIYVSLTDSEVRLSMSGTDDNDFSISLNYDGSYDIE